MKSGLLAGGQPEYQSHFWSCVPEPEPNGFVMNRILYPALVVIAGLGSSTPPPRIKTSDFAPANLC